MEEGSPLPLPHLCPTLPHPMWTLSHSDFIPATAGGHNKPFHVSGRDVLFASAFEHRNGGGLLWIEDRFVLWKLLSFTVFLSKKRPVFCGLPSAWAGVALPDIASPTLCPRSSPALLSLLLHYSSCY